MERRNSMNRVVIFGTGVFYQNRKACIQKKDVVAFIDNDVNRQGKELEGAWVYAPNDIATLEYDYVVLMSKSIDSMKRQLIDLGVSEDKIITYVEYLKIREEDEMYIYWYGKMALHQPEKIVILITHELSNTGAPIVLFYMAEILKRNGYYPVVFSRKDGELREEYRKKQISLIVDNGLCGNSFMLCDLIKRARCVVCNTLEVGDLIEDCAQNSKKVVWWLHEGRQSYREDTIGYCVKRYNSNVEIYAVSELSKNAFIEHSYEQAVGILQYGIPDNGEEKKMINQKICFAVIGTICTRKGQDIVIDAIKLLSKDEIEKTEFWFVGKILERDQFEKIQHCELDNVFYKGEMDSEQMQKIYRAVDVVVCPSREDPLPVVLTEGMMHGKVCIMSENCGTVDMIRDGVDAYICSPNSAEKLATILRRIINNKHGLEEMMKKSREVFEKNFVLEQFESRILGII